ncbi:hypothetical protein LOK49_LG12G00704 [Camellia lanceoleosa]|uniref:Uncharacterized protein n=1 Tax=Camellia lanceoleosa TaxID=1840588 RepID=A0ACC0FVH2_9ERIC|nr:hypothetical protein LOK49_LG12G00704 [Camellia lanceoleosa]
MASAVGEIKRILFKSVITDKYARPIDEDRYNGYLSADGKGDPRMYLEETSSGSGLYRIKSGDTNKYWQVKSHENPWITADADPHAVADPDRTLFQIECFVRPFIPVTPATYVPLLLLLLLLLFLLLFVLIQQSDFATTISKVMHAFTLTRITPTASNYLTNQTRTPRMSLSVRNSHKPSPPIHWWVDVCG